jgi:hypothetical protein
LISLIQILEVAPDLHSSAIIVESQNHMLIHARTKPPNKKLNES